MDSVKNNRKEQSYVSHHLLDISSPAVSDFTELKHLTDSNQQQDSIFAAHHHCSYDAQKVTAAVELCAGMRCYG